MTLPVFFVPRADLLDAAQVVVEGPEGHHAAVVRRLRVGEQVQLTDGQGTVVEGTISAGDRTGITVDVQRHDAVPRPEPSIVVVQALPKGERAELAVSLLTEVGVDRIVPWAADRCVVRWDDRRAERALTKWRNAAHESAKQSRRAWWPEVAGLASSDEVAGLLSSVDLGVVLYEAADTSLTSVELPTTGDVVLVVGPEGGITEAEKERFEAAGATLARAGSAVMRTSTAGAVAAAVVLSRTARWST